MTVVLDVGAGCPDELARGGERGRPSLFSSGGACDVPLVEAATTDPRVPFRADVLATWQHIELPNLRPCTLVAAGASAPGWVYDLDLVTATAPAIATPVAALRHVLPRLLFARVLEIGAAVPLVAPFVPCAPGAVDRLLAEALRQEVTMVIVDSLGEGDTTALAGPLRRHGFARVPAPAVAVLDLPYATFDDYVGAMRHRYRQRLRTTLRRSAHLRSEVIDDFAGLAPELAALWRCVYDRAKELRLGVLPPSYFRAAAAIPEMRVLALRRPDGSLASFGLLLDGGSRLHWLQCGFREAAGRDESAYFRLIYEVVRHAIERGSASVDMGVTTLGPKLDAGAVPVRSHAWIRHRRRVVQRLYASLARGLLAPEVPPPSNVFKSP